MVIITIIALDLGHIMNVNTQQRTGSLLNNSNYTYIITIVKTGIIIGSAIYNDGYAVYTLF